MSMKDFKNIKNLHDTPFGYTLSIIGGKWKMTILYWLFEVNTVRYNELKRLIGSISHKMLSSQLKDLEKDGLIIRKEYPQIPPRVEYSLTQKGRSLFPLMEEMCKWGEPNKSE
ncbi:winged helix-turn-helix transcriptional regulator [Sebaldella termitidis]|uniref:winged helix-turn-helix transcriptional regulator n=1 Tax=Sebaldella termitidis TaxID=826 RepID=UPI003EB82FD5